MHHWLLLKVNFYSQDISDEHNAYVSAVEFTEFDKYLVAGYLGGYILLIDINNVDAYKKKEVPFEVSIPEENQDKSNTVITKFYLDLSYIDFKK
jgi:hypothetical protein